jgi:hypothetical protein
VRFDLDPADLGEVRRRVVEPVLTTMFRPGELTDLHLTIEIPAATWSSFMGPDLEPAVWLRLTVGDETFQHSLANPGFWLEDGTWMAEELAGKLQDWICETSFGWGDLRGGPDAAALPGPPASPPGVRTVTVHMNEPGKLPLWEDGSPAQSTGLTLSPDLTADLAAWQALGERLAQDLAEAAEADQWPVAEARGPFGSKRFGHDEMQKLQEAADRRRIRALAEWRAWVATLEALRDTLVQRLRDELGDGFLVPTPPRLPDLS